MVNNALFDRFAPWQCLLCRRPSQRPLPLCLPCENELPTNTQACAQCALPLPQSQSQSQYFCPDCQTSQPAFRETCAPLIYAEPVSNMLQQFKFRGDMHFLPLLIEQLIGPVQANLELNGAPDYLVPVPLHWRKKWRRGFNQSAVLAHALSKHPKLKKWKLRVDDTACRKRRVTPDQHDLSLAQRKRNLNQAFICDHDMAGKYLIVIDDVMTTGTTVASLAQVLRDAGAERVDICCLARTPQPG